MIGQHPGRLVLDGNNVRVESDIPVWDAAGNVHHRPVLTVSTGGPTRTLFPAGIGLAGKPQGVLDPPSRKQMMADGPNLWPVLAH